MIYLNYDFKIKCKKKYISLFIFPLNSVITKYVYEEVK
jgi:hypothetical protein